ncbi:MAG: BON domain-containing protein [Gemmatimonas sp.]|jgi:osmotically-inducible protein OsmY|uniref:BON domain-containing protein n=1 Tax=Gemmatimonas sp. TaxID=1962908 RepID=UPI0022BCDFB4|nr:BON domain-containing protein [Gemmatimonas sp.]MCE2953768.1 BON domain-containing protein [Gemmatimonas sp.]MCZ8013622.1 BON domain-containing protein [Gemmatimonas sp.]MCZ8265879.1 BON domain-containing protein [Gemmatimonas sp.]
MLNDLQITEQVRRELEWDPSVRDNEIAVIVRSGVVTLGGTVDSFAVKANAARAAERVRGVQAVADELHVVIPTAHVRSDTDIAHAVVSALKWNVQVPADRIKVRVDEGWVTLDGTVTWEFQRKAAARTVRELTGVHGVRNLLTLQTSASPADVRHRIEDAMKRQAELEAADIAVEVVDGCVTLKGRVHSSFARGLAEQAAWSAPGVAAVDDRLKLQF